MEKEPAMIVIERRRYHGGWSVTRALTRYRWWTETGLVAAVIIALTAWAGV
jgi:hypothetical protein